MLRRRASARRNPRDSPELVEGILAAGAAFDLGHHLVAVAELVDQLRRQRLRRRQRRAVDQAAQLGRLQTAAARDVVDHLCEQPVDQRLQILAMRPGEARFEEGVGRRLELHPAAALETHAQLVEPVLEEGHLGGDADDAEIAGWLQPDLVEGRGEVPAAQAAGVSFGVDDRELARGAEEGDGLAQLLHRSDAGLAAADDGDQADDALVGGGTAQRVDRLDKRRAMRAEQSAAGAGLSWRMAPVEFQHRALSDRRVRVADDAAQQHKAADAEEGDEADDGQQADDEPSHGLDLVEGRRRPERSEGPCGGAGIALQAFDRDTAGSFASLRTTVC